MAASGIAVSSDPVFERLKQGLELQKAGLRREAEAVYRAVLNHSPQHPLALHLAGTVAGQLGRPRDAVELLRRSVLLHPGDPLAWNNLANALQDAGANEAALDASLRAVTLAPGYANGWVTRAIVLQTLSRTEEARGAFQTAVRLDPESARAWCGYWRTCMESCLWDDLLAVRGRVDAALHGASSALLPFEALAYSDDPGMHLATAKAYGDEITAREGLEPSPPTNISTAARRVRIGYLSSDFHEHATAHLTVGMFEAHDRSRFEVFGISCGPDDGSPMRSRLRMAFEHFVDAAEWTSERLAGQIKAWGIDILVDLKGYTRDARAAVFLRRPAPIQVNYLGFPGTLGQSAYDYIIGDAVVTPFDQQAHYVECIVQMPGSYQVNDDRRAIAPLPPSREEEGLPSQGFVFAAFNNTYKITPQFFELWMQVLRRVPGSILWLLSESSAVQERLRRAAAGHGVAPERLVFARRLPLAQHLARHAHAGLLLDTLPYNAHTTASDALWAGVPVVTLAGRSFAGRVAGSLLRAVGLQDLVTDTPQAYVDLAVRIAQNPAFAADIRERLQRGRVEGALFDTDRFTRYFEAAFLHMYKQRAAGATAEPFAVADLVQQEIT